VPINVIQREVDDFTSAETKTRQQKQHRVITLPYGAILIALLQ